MTRSPRIAHLGLGAFARAHQAWYTQEVSDGWGIVAIPNRSTAILDRLREQEFVYSVVVRHPDFDVVGEMPTVVAISADALADPAIAILTMTVSEAGYLAGAHPIGLIADGLRARRAGGGGPIAMVPCDNVPANGRALRDVLLASVDADLASWIDDNVSFVSTIVDRITPATTDADRATARERLGWDDQIPVVTEPFTEWVLQGDFPAGRPAWERGGAQFVDDVEPYENRKLWLLNAAHSLLAYRGLETGHETVFDAWADPVLAAEVEQLWVEAREVLELPPADVDEWLAALRIRWQNPRIEHRLAQIALGGEQKIPARILSVASRRKEAGLPVGVAETETVAAYMRYRDTRSMKEASQ
jgi:fructuronate reductase